MMASRPFSWQLSRTVEKLFLAGVMGSCWDGGVRRQEIHMQFPVFFSQIAFACFCYRGSMAFLLQV